VTCSRSLVAGEHGLHFLGDSLGTGFSCDLLESKPFSTVGNLLTVLLGLLSRLLDEDWGLGDNLAGWLLLGCGLLSVWVLLDLSLDLLVDIFEGFSLELLLPLGELLLERLWVVLLEEVIVFLNVDTVDVLEMLLGGEDFLLLGTGIVLLLSSLSSLFLDLFGSETWESLLVM